MNSISSFVDLLFDLDFVFFVVIQRISSFFDTTCCNRMYIIDDMISDNRRPIYVKIHIVNWTKRHVYKHRFWKSFSTFTTIFAPFTWWISYDQTYCIHSGGVFLSVFGTFWCSLRSLNSRSAIELGTKTSRNGWPFSTTWAWLCLLSVHHCHRHVENDRFSLRTKIPIYE